MNAKVVTPHSPYKANERKEKEMKNVYDERQRNKFIRKQNGVKPFEILKVEGKKITVPLPKVFGKGKTAVFELSTKFNPEIHIVGNFVDLILEYTVCNGKASSYRLTYVGPTPPEFLPLVDKMYKNFPNKPGNQEGELK